jgi:integrase
MWAEATQLWRWTSADCVVVRYVRLDGPEYRSAAGVRVLYYPDGRPCWPANMYLACKLTSAPIRIGTLNVYACELSHLIRFVFQHGLRYEDFTNDVVHRFSRALVGQTRPHDRSVKRRGGRCVNAILRRTIDFLTWYSASFLDRALVGLPEQGCFVTVIPKTFRRDKRLVAYLWHSAMVPNDIPKKVKPIARRVYQQLLDACPSLAKSRLVVNRTRLLLKVFADTGARRVEVSNIEVQDIYDALRHPASKLRLMTAKREQGAERLVPIPKETLYAAQGYIERVRALHLARLTKLGRLKSNPPWLFLAERGTQLHVNSINCDLSRLRRKAGIAEAAAAHMFRHRWITIQVVERLKDFIGKRLPMDVAVTLLSRVASITGHRSIDSLWIYIDLAFDELGIWNTAKDLVWLRFNLEAAQREVREIFLAHEDGSIPTAEETKRLDRILTDLLQDVPDDAIEKLRRFAPLSQALSMRAERP